LKNNSTTLVSSVEHFWNTTILNISNDFDGLSTFHWPNVVGLLVMWTIIYLCLWKGIKVTSRVALFTALFPYLPMVALFIRGMTLDGAWHGLKYYLIADTERLLNKKAWIQAAGKISIEKKNFFYRNFFYLFKDMFFGHMVLVGVLFQLYQVIIVLIIIFIVILL
jgi:hypothetical protein